MNPKKQDHSRGLVYAAHEFLFSANMAILATSVIFMAMPASSIPFVHAEASIISFFHVRQTDFITGYLEFWIPSILLGFCLWLTFRLAAHGRAVREFLRSPAGILILFAPPVVWFCEYQKTGWPIGFPYKGAPVELIAALMFAWLFLNKNSRFSNLVISICLTAHYAFWYWFSFPDLHPNWGVPGYTGPLALTLGFASAFAWALYVQDVPESPALQSLSGGQPSNLDRR